MVSGTFLPLAIQFEDFYKIKCMYLEFDLHILDLRYLDQNYFLKIYVWINCHTFAYAHTFNDVTVYFRKVEWHCPPLLQTSQSINRALPLSSDGRVC